MELRSTGQRNSGQYRSTSCPMNGAYCTVPRFGQGIQGTTHISTSKRIRKTGKQKIRARQCLFSLSLKKKRARQWATPPVRRYVYNKLLYSNPPRNAKSHTSVVLRRHGALLRSHSPPSRTFHFEPKPCSPLAFASAPDQTATEKSPKNIRISLSLGSSVRK